MCVCVATDLVQGSTSTVTTSNTTTSLTVGAVYEGDIPSRMTVIGCTVVEGETETVERESSSRRSKEERKLAIMMMSKKRKRLFDQIMKSRKMKAKEVGELKRKRKHYEESLEQDSSKRVRMT